MKKKAKFLIYPFILMGFVLVFANGCTIEKTPDPPSPPTPTLSIGQNYQGGIIAYILQPNDPGYDHDTLHGLIAAHSDLATDPKWGCIGILISGADGTAIGTGNQNTIDIMAGCSTPGIAARLCGDLTLNGYSDWYLPSKDELHKLYLRQTDIGGFSSWWYWSSTEYDEYNTWRQFFSISYYAQYYHGKGNSNKVRAVRSF